MKDYFGVKLMLGASALVIGLFALAFAVFGWSQTVYPFFSAYNRVICICGSFGAIVSGSLLIKESIGFFKPSLVKHH